MRSLRSSTILRVSRISLHNALVIAERAEPSSVVPGVALDSGRQLFPHRGGREWPQTKSRKIAPVMFERSTLKLAGSASNRARKARTADVAAGSEPYSAAADPPELSTAEIRQIRAVLTLPPERG